MEHVGLKPENFTRLLHPKLVTLIVTVGPEGRVNGMPAAWVMPVSRNPPLICAAISPKRYTYELIARAKDFTVNVMSVDFVKEVDYMGSVSGRDVDKFARVGLTLKESKTVRSPYIGEALACMECTLYQEYEAGDHMLILGKVNRALVGRGLFKNTYDPKSVKVLLHLGGELYTTTSSEIVQA
jgi:flavin reductase (DIM6/NTAB) family NADH-FMN oxidoreductase RutF